MDRALEKIAEFIISIVVGALGGWVCGFLILSFGYYIGRSGDNPSEGFGYWNPMAQFGLAGFYGVPLGVIIFPIGYWTLLRGSPVFMALLITFVGTLLGGLCGALIEPPVAVLTGLAGFFIAAVFVKNRIWD